VALFLRNHDELTLEMVTDEDRELHVPAVRDRPAGSRKPRDPPAAGPLLGNDRRAIELLNSLLFSLPGTPVLYYGDEIGMGTTSTWGPERCADPHAVECGP